MLIEYTTYYFIQMSTEGRRIFVYGESGCGKTEFAKRYAYKKQSLLIPLNDLLPPKKWWKRHRKFITKNTVFYWDYLACSQRKFQARFEKMIRTFPNNDFIICSIHEPNDYSSKMKDIFTRNDFRYYYLTPECMVPYLEDEKYKKLLEKLDKLIDMI